MIFFWPENENDDPDRVVGDGQAEEGQRRAVRREQRPEECPRRHRRSGALNDFFDFLN